MARAIPRSSWSEAELQRERTFHWQYMLNTWLVPGPSVLSEPSDAEAVDSWIGPSPEALHENGWFLEPERICEQ